MITEYGINFIRNRAFAEWVQLDPNTPSGSQYDAYNVAHNTPYGMWLRATFGDQAIDGWFDESQDREYLGLMNSAWGYDNPWLYGNDYTDWAFSKFASLGLTWVRDWAMIGQWLRLVRSAPKTNNVVSGPIVFDSGYDWSVLDRTVDIAAEYGMKLVLTLPHPYPSVVDECGWRNPGNDGISLGGQTHINTIIIDYLLAPFAAELARRYQNYTHIYIDPLNEASYGQYGGLSVLLQRAVYHAVKDALPVGKKGNIKVQLLSQFYSDQLAMINAIGNELIYEEFVTPHYYPTAGVNTFDLSGLPAIRTALDGFGRTDVKIQFGEFGAWEGVTSAQSAQAIPNMASSINASGLVDSALYWPCINTNANGVSASIYSFIGIWDYGTFNQAALPEPFTVLADLVAIDNMNLSPEELPAIWINSRGITTGNSFVTLNGFIQTGLTVQVIAGVMRELSYPTATTWSATFTGLSLGENTIAVRAIDGLGAEIGTASTVVIYEVPSITGDALQGSSAISPASLIGVVVADDALGYSAQSVGQLSGQIQPVGLQGAADLSAAVLIGTVPVNSLLSSGAVSAGSLVGLITPGQLSSDSSCSLSTLVGVVYPNDLVSSSALSSADLQAVGLLSADGLAGTSAITEGSLVGVIPLDACLSGSWCSEPSLIGKITANPLVSISTLSAVTLERKALTSAGSIRSPSGGYTRMFRGDGQPLTIYRYVDGTWQ
jgi:hypothetical protein